MTEANAVGLGETFTQNVRLLNERSRGIVARAPQLSDSEWIEAAVAQVEADTNRVMSRVWAKASSGSHEPHSEFFRMLSEVCESLTGHRFEPDRSISATIDAMRALWSKGLSEFNIPITFAPVQHLSKAPAVDFTSGAEKITGGMPPAQWAQKVRSMPPQSTQWGNAINVLWVYLVGGSAATGDDALTRVNLRMNMILAAVPRDDMQALYMSARSYLGPVEWIRLSLEFKHAGFAVPDFD